MDENSLQDVCFDNPISEPRKRKEKTTAITLRMPIWWIKRLDRIARERSFRDKEEIRRSDLIREAVFEQFIEDLERVPTYRDHEQEEERCELKTMSRILRRVLSTPKP